MSRIQSISIKDDYRLEALLDNGSSITLNLQSRLGTVRFGLLSDPAFFAAATTDGSFIRWKDQVEISLTRTLSARAKMMPFPRSTLVVR